jgi:hypothetical protein
MNDTPPAVIPIKALSRDPTYQVRRKLDDATVNRYKAVISSGKAMPPVRVANVNGVAVLVDGWHRVAAYESLGITTVQAHISKMTKRDAEWTAAYANMEHGKPLTTAETKTVYMKYMKTKQHLRPNGTLKTLRQIGHELGRGHTTIRAWEWKHYPSIARSRGSEQPIRGDNAVTEASPPPDLKQAMEALEQLEAAFVRSSDPQVRGDIVWRTGVLLEELKSAGNWDNPLF